ncbi:tetratricopeptide repeat protein [Nonomuraea sp. NPDC047529]|uniref:tetratricopeptide repeat protein n=1 Tax=Nonomuraea sp. NPDC047529 TaxID=3155623 RepID=UPI0033EFDC6A
MTDETPARGVAAHGLRSAAMCTNWGIVQTGDHASATFQPPRRPLPQAAQVRVSPSLIGLPRCATPTFVGRHCAMGALRAALESTAATGVISQALVGLGGVGKSELALQYADRHRHDYQLVWWIDAEAPAQIQAGLAGLARALTSATDSVAAAQATQDEAATWALTWLSVHPNWLVVFDNVEDAADIEPYLARLSHGHALITTRRDIGWQDLGLTPLRLDVLDRQESIDLLSRRIGPLPASEAELLHDLADQLGDLPLAITQAGAYISRTPRVTVAKYLQLLKDAPARMHAAIPAGGDSARVVAKVWALSYQRIRTVDPLATDLLRLLACFASDSLPCSVLDRVNDADDIAVGEALALLASYSLINLTLNLQGHSANGEQEERASVHRLIQATTLAQLSDNERQAARDQAAALLQAALPEDPEALANWPMYRRLVPHARAVLPFDSPGLHCVRDFLTASGDYRTALSMARQIHTHCIQMFGGDDPGTLAAQHDIALCTGMTGDAASARDQFAVLFPIRERVQGSDHPGTLSTRHELARWTGEAGSPAKARDMYTALLPLEEGFLGSEHLHILITRHELARWTGEAGQPAEARDMYAALLSREEEFLTADDPSLLSTRHELARWTGEAGEPAKARDQLAVLIPIQERVLGPDHPKSLSTRANLAIWTGYAGDETAARDQLATLLPFQEGVLGVDHPDTLTTRHNLAFWTGMTGDTVAARDQFAALLPIRERIRGADHPDILITRANLANWTGYAGNVEAARNQLAALLPAIKRILGNRHPHTLIVRNYLAHWTRQTGYARRPYLRRPRPR